MEYRNINDLVLLEKNPRIIKDDNFKILCESIKNNKDFFEARPIILSDRTGELVVIAGNQRLKASKKLKLKQVPTFLIQGLTEDKEKEIIIRDNVELGEFDFDILANEWSEEDLKNWGLNTNFEEILKNDDDLKQDFYEPKFQIIIDCENELEQENIYLKLQKDNIKCRVQSL